MRNKTVNHELYEQYMRTHCVDAVHYATDTERPDTLSKTDSSIYDITYRRP